jgi:hypothetical protein
LEFGKPENRLRKKFTAVSAASNTGREERRRALANLGNGSSSNPYRTGPKISRIGNRFFIFPNRHHDLRTFSRRHDEVVAAAFPDFS